MTAKNEERREDRPPGLGTAALSVLLGFVALLGVGGTSGVVKGLVATDTLWGPWSWQTTLTFAKNLLMAVGGIGGLLWLKPWEAWKDSGIPLSPATRRTNKLFALSGLVGAVGALALALSTAGKSEPSSAFMNGPVSVGIAVVVIAFWLLSNVIAWWWYFSADEHERRANDVGFLAGGGVFMVATPVWWIAARAGLAPQPDAMILWIVTMVVMLGGWFWYRYR